MAAGEGQEAAERDIISLSSAFREPRVQMALANQCASGAVGAHGICVLSSWPLGCM